MLFTTRPFRRGFSQAVTYVTNLFQTLFTNPVTITVIASDVPSDTLAYAFDCDNNNAFEVGPQTSNRATCQFSSDGSFTVTTKVTNEDGGTTQGTTLVIVSPANDSFLQIFLPLVLR